MLFLSVLVFVIILIIIFFLRKKTNILLKTTSKKKEISISKLLQTKNQYDITYISDNLDDGWSINFWLYLKSIENEIYGRKYLVKWNNIVIIFITNTA